MKEVEYLKTFLFSFSFPGEYMIAKPQFPECCWDCAKCKGKSFTNTSHMTNCVDCPKGTWPTADYSDCSPIEASYLHLNEAWAVVIVSVSLIGFAVVVCTCAVFIKFRGTAVVRAASRQLCHVLLLGIALFYVTPLSYVIYKPSKISCKLLPFMFGLCFVLVVGKSHAHVCIQLFQLTLPHESFKPRPQVSLGFLCIDVSSPKSALRSFSNDDESWYFKKYFALSNIFKYLSLSTSGASYSPKFDQYGRRDVI